MNSFKKPGPILVLVLAIFMIKGVFLATISPIFDGQDESRHYNSIQYLSERGEKSWNPSQDINSWDQDKDDLSTYRYSEEIKNTAIETGSEVLRSDIFNTVNFANGYNGYNEAKINSSPWKPVNYTEPDVVTGSAYHKIGSAIESFFASQSILVRFYSIRIFSVLLGTLSVFLSFLIAKNIGFSEKQSLLLTSIVTFQPKFSMYFTNINYDVLLIPMFFAFTLGIVFMIKNGKGIMNACIVVFSTMIAIETKRTGVVLLIILTFLLAFLAYSKLKYKFKNAKRLSFIFMAAALFLSFIFFWDYLPLNKFGGAYETLISFWKYVKETITPGKLALSSRTYWGTLDWTDSWFLANTIDVIKYIEIVSLIGLILFFFSRRPEIRWMPEKKLAALLVLMIIALQLGIRFADWILFIQYGKPVIGAPGRYFLPNLAAHIILVYVGLGMVFEKMRQIRIKGRQIFTQNAEVYFERSLILGLFLMFYLSMYLIFNVIIYRFYL